MPDNATWILAHREDFTGLEIVLAAEIIALRAALKEAKAALKEAKA